VFVAAVVRLTDPLRGASGAGANPGQGITFYPSWSPPGILSAVDRLRHSDDWGEAWYESVADHREGILLVARKSPTSVGPGQIWYVQALDRAARVVCEGNAHAISGYIPHSIVEMWSDDRSLAPEIRGRWLLGIEFQDAGGAPALLIAARRHLQKLPASFVCPIKWSEDGPDSGEILECDDLRIRPVDPYQYSWLKSGPMAPQPGAPAP